MVTGSSESLQALLGWPKLSLAGPSYPIHKVCLCMWIMSRETPWFYIFFKPHFHPTSCHPPHSILPKNVSFILAICASWFQGSGFSTSFTGWSGIPPVYVGVVSAHLHIFRVWGLALFFKSYDKW